MSSHAQGCCCGGHVTRAPGACADAPEAARTGTPLDGPTLDKNRGLAWASVPLFPRVCDPIGSASVVAREVAEDPAEMNSHRRPCVWRLPRVCVWRDVPPEEARRDTAHAPHAVRVLRSAGVGDSARASAARHVRAIAPSFMCLRQSGFSRPRRNSRITAIRDKGSGLRTSRRIRDGAGGRSLAVLRSPPPRGRQGNAPTAVTQTSFQAHAAATYRDW